MHLLLLHQNLEYSLILIEHSWQVPLNPTCLSWHASIPNGLFAATSRNTRVSAISVATIAPVISHGDACSRACLPDPIFPISVPQCQEISLLTHTLYAVWLAFCNKSYFLNRKVFFKARKRYCQREDHLVHFASYFLKKVHVPRW